MPEKLKKGWTRVAFGDVVQLCRERAGDPAVDGFDRFVGLDHLDPGDLKIRRWGNVADGTTFTSVFRAGQVLFGKRRAYQRKVAVPDFDGVCSGDIYVLEPKNEHLLSELLPFICQTDGFFEHAVGTSAGSLSPRTNWASLASYEFALPPLEEQRRIAEVLISIRTAQDSYGRVSSTTARAVQALIAEFLREVEDTATPSMLQKHARISYGLTIDPERRKYTEQIPYLRVANVQRGAFDLTDIKTVGKKQDDDVYRLAKGDVLLVEGHADVAQIGRAAVWADNTTPMFHQNHLIRVRCGDSLDPGYLCLMVNSVRGQAYFRAHAKSTSGLNTINSTVVKQHMIPVPSREIQSKVVDRASLGVRLMNEMSKRQDHLGRIYRALLGLIGGDE